MKRIIIVIASIFTCFTEGVSQTTFNRIYRLDSAQKLATVFNSLRIKNNQIFTAGIGNVKFDSSSFISVGITAQFDMFGNVIRSKDYWTGVEANYFENDVLLFDKDSINLIGGNHEPYITFLRTDYVGNVYLSKKYYPDSFPIWRYGNPSALVKYKEGYAFTASTGRPNNRPAVASLIVVDYTGNVIKTVHYDEDNGNNDVGKLWATKNNSLILATTTFLRLSSDTSYFFKSKIREIDSLGNTKWYYSTPANRYIYSEKFEPLANGNYLMWGNEEISTFIPFGRRWIRTVLAVVPYIAEISPQTGLVWERRIFLEAGGRAFAMKILRDSSIVLTGFYDDGNFNTSAFLIKFRNRYDSLYRRNFRTPGFAASNAIYYPNQIEELNNGDLLIGGSILHNISLQQPKAGEWGWLVRTDSLGCSLQPSSCRVPTTEVEKPPLSIKAYPNPVNDQLTIDYDFADLPKEVTLQLTDILGRVVHCQKLVNIQGQTYVPVAQLPMGIYIVSIKFDNQILWQTKVVVQHY